MTDKYVHGVYCIHSPVWMPNVVKIGKSHVKDHDTHLHYEKTGLIDIKDIDRHNSFKWLPGLKLIHWHPMPDYSEGAAYAIEELLHKMFEKYRISGCEECYQKTPEILLWWSYLKGESILKISSTSKTKKLKVEKHKYNNDLKKEYFTFLLEIGQDILAGQNIVKWLKDFNHLENGVKTLEDGYRTDTLGHHLIFNKNGKLKSLSSDGTYQFEASQGQRKKISLKQMMEIT